MSIVFVQSDTAPPVQATLHQQGNSTAINLTGATVKFQMRRANDKFYRVNAACTVVSAAAGTVSYTWGANDLGVPGDYVIQFEITFPGGAIQTTATPIAVTVRQE